MPKRNGREPESGMPSTVQRSDDHAQDIWREAHDSAVDTYGEGGRAHRVAYAALKHVYRKSGDRWVRKDRKGPSDPQAARGGPGPAKAKTAGGRVASTEATKSDLMDQARELDIPGRSKMNKRELADAILERS